MWHKDQKAVASCLLRLLSEYDSILGRKEGRGCHARDAIKAYGVKTSASVTGFVLAEGTHQTDSFRQSIWLISL